MKSSSLLALPACLAAIVYAANIQASYVEQLHLKPLPSDALYAGFNFTASTPLDDYDRQNFRFFPRSLAQILQFTHTSELHLRFTLGRWDEESWGSRPRSGRREGGAGVELWAWLQASNQSEAEERWSGLVNSLSGLFCASLNFIDQSRTSQPVLTFDPEGSLEPGSSSLHLMHGMLPHEVVCTENLTPFLKLLPCKGKAGISSLLDGHKVFDANWQAMAIDVRPVCAVSNQCELEIEQTVDMVLDLDRSMRPKDNPIPRPLPIEQIVCDESKGHNGHDTCYPVRQHTNTEWTLSRIFGRTIPSSCVVGEHHAAADIILDIPVAAVVEVLPETALEDVGMSSQLRSYRLGDGQDVDIKLPSLSVEDSPQNDRSLLTAVRQMTGHGQERGGMHAVITNPHTFAQRVVYLENLPWFLRPYMHTLNINGATVEKMYYTPAIDRQKGTHLELLLTIPAQTTVELTYDFEKAILRYTEYPPDANRGFDIPPAIIRILPLEGDLEQQGSYLRTTSLLLPLPTPDFSMPYNVIILTSTVIALGFGSIFNLLIRRFVLLEEVPKNPLATIVRNTIAKLKGGTASSRIQPTVKHGSKVTQDSKGQMPTINPNGNAADPVRLRKTCMEDIDGMSR